MLDEGDMTKEKAWLMGKRVTKAVESFRKRRINAQYVKDRVRALSTILQMIPEGVTVGAGDSVTLQQIGILSKLKSLNGIEVLDPFERDEQGFYTRDIDAVFEVMRKALTADYFLTGANAITIDGKIVSTPPQWNRQSCSGNDLWP